MSGRDYYDLKHGAERRAKARFEAKYPGTCLNCDDPIEVGDLLRWDGEYAVHAACDAKPELPVRETCPHCFLEIAVNGECGCES